MTKIVGPWHCSTSQIVKWLHAPRFVCHCKHPRILAFSHILLLNTYIKSLKSANITRVAYLTEVFIPTHPSCLLLYVHRTRGERARAPSNANLLFSMYHFLPGTRVSSPFSNKKIETQAVTKMQRSRIRNNVFFFSSSSFIYTWKETCILHFERATTGPSKCFARSIKTFPCVCSGLCPENFMALDETLVKILCCSMRRSQADHNKDWTNVGHGNCVFWAWACHFWCHRVMHAFVTCNIHAPKLRPDCSTSVHCKKVFFFFIPHHPQSIYLHSPRGIHRHWVRSFISLSILPTIAWMQTTRTWRDCQNDSGGYNHKIRRQWKTFVMRNMYSIMPFILNVVVRIVGHKDIRPEVAVAFTRKALYRSAVMRNDKLIIGTVLFWNWNQQDFRNHNDMFASLCGCVVAMQIFRTQVHSMFQ